MPLIGFGGAPFTLASYAIEGGHSNNFALTKALMYSQPARVAPAVRHAGSIMGEYMKAQIEAGVQVIQIFDSWVGALNSADYREFVCRTRRRFSTAIAGPGRADHSFRHRHGGHSAGHARSRRRRDWRRLAHSAGRSVGAHRPRPRHSGQPRSHAAARAARPHARRAPTTCWSAPPGGRATFSIWVTASCRSPRSITCRRSRSTFTATASRMPDRRTAARHSPCS